MRGFRSSARRVWRTIIGSLPSIGMAETGSEIGSTSTNTSDEKKFNEFTLEKNPSETPLPEGGTHQDEKKFNEFTPEKNPSKTPREGGTHQDEKKFNEFTPEKNPSKTPQEGGTHQDEKKFNEFTPEKNPSKTPQEGGTHQGTSKDDSMKKKKWWTWEKKDFNKMSLEEKRFYYKCGKNFMTLDEILSWPEYVESHMSNLIDFGILRKGDKFHNENNKINKKVSLWQGDITHLEIDAIVNAANTSLRGGGGVDGCIHRAAGGDLLDECITLRGCKTGDAKITSGYKLPAKKVIHTVGPIGENKKKLQSCYKSCLKLVLEHKLKTVAFCCISTGIYGYPNEEAATVAVETVKEWLEKNGDEVDRIIFCVFLEDDNYIYHQLMLKYFPCTVTSDEDDDQGDSSKEKASANERGKTEHKKGDEKSVKKLDGRDVLNKEGQNKEDVGSGDHAKVVDTAAETGIEEDVETDALDQPTKSDTTEEKTRNKEDVETDALDQPTTSDTAKEKAEMGDVETDALDQPTKLDTAKEKAEMDDVETDALDQPTKSDTTEEKTRNKEDVETDVGGGGLESAGVDSPQESKMHVDRCDNEEDSVDKYTEKEEEDETTERAKEGEGVQINSSKPDGEKVENDEVVHEMKKRKRDGDEKMELDVEESGDGDKMDTEDVPGDKAQDETVESDKDG